MTRIADRVGVLIGSGMGGAETLDAGMETVLTEGPSRLSPFFMPMFLGNMASGTVAIATGARGPNFAPVSACASSAHAIGEAAAIIRRGEADVMIAGGSEAPLARMVVAGFNAMGALSTRNDDPAAASRPFDAERDGFVLGEGGAALILESAEHAARRGASVLAELTGYATTDDANHMVQPAPGGIGAARAMTPGARRRRSAARRHRLHQCPRHVDAAQREIRDPGDQGGVRRRGLSRTHQLDQIDDRPFAGSRGRTGSGLGDHGHRARDRCRRRSTRHRRTRTAIWTTCRTLPAARPSRTS